MIRTISEELLCLEGESKYKVSDPENEIVVSSSLQDIEFYKESRPDAGITLTILTRLVLLKREKQLVITVHKTPLSNL